jgi:hypothetical protein
MIFKQKILLASIFVCAAVCLANDAEQSKTVGNFESPAAVKEVLSGKRAVANAAWWGFKTTDSTEAVQAAINSGASKVVIPYMGAYWIVRPIFLASNQEIVFEPGVVVAAKKGEFKGKHDCLFSAVGKKNITLVGYAATLRMQKSDYMSFRYTKSEHRHIVSFRNCDNIEVLGLTLKDSGGDGVFIGPTRGDPSPCRKVLIRDCICDNNYRQGISVCCVDNLLVENCIVRNTRGTPPKAGVLFEPSNAKSVISNCVVNNCILENNAGAGLRVQLSRHPASPQVSMLFVNCHVKGGGIGVQVGPIRDNGPKGLIEFRSCTVEDTRFPGIYIYDKSVKGAFVRFQNCNIRNTGEKRPFPRVPIHLASTAANLARSPGGIEFVDCYVYDRVNRPVLTTARVEGVEGFSQIKGNISVFNPYGAKTDRDSQSKHPDLEIKWGMTRE